MNISLDSNQVTEQYQSLADELMVFTNDLDWDKAILHCEIYSSMIAKERWLEFNNKEVWMGNDIPDNIREKTSDSCYFLRDVIFNLTGDRIWGLTFTLYPDGKFEIEYDYDKPEDYEETDEVINGDEINQTFLK